jgi:hypothetical protein
MIFGFCLQLRQLRHGAQGALTFPSLETPRIKKATRPINHYIALLHARPPFKNLLLWSYRLLIMFQLIILFEQTTLYAYNGFQLLVNMLYAIYV